MWMHGKNSLRLRNTIAIFFLSRITVEFSLVIVTLTLCRGVWMVTLMVWVEWHMNTMESVFFYLLDLTMSQTAASIWSRETRCPSSWPPIKGLFAPLLLHRKYLPKCLLTEIKFLLFGSAAKCFDMVLNMLTFWVSDHKTFKKRKS